MATHSHIVKLLLIRAPHRVVKAELLTLDAQALVRVVDVGVGGAVDELVLATVAVPPLGHSQAPELDADVLLA